MVEQHWDCFKNVSWACTFKSINWLEEGFSSAKLELLGINYGWFYEGHDAFNDCEACLALLSETLPKRNETVFSVLREYATKPNYLIKAIDAPYDKRNILDWHHDASYYHQTYPSYNAAFCLVPITDNSVKNGTVKFIPKSHKLKINHHKFLLKRLLSG